MRLFLLLFTVFIATVINSYAETWVYWFTDNKGNTTYYDKDSITEVEKGVTRLAVRTDYSKEGRADFIKSRRERGLEIKPYKRLARSVSVWYIKCDEKKDDLYAVFEYDFENKIISTYKTKELKYEPIKSGTIGEILHLIACEK